MFIFFMDFMVSLLRDISDGDKEEEYVEEEEGVLRSDERKGFKFFCFEDYVWRVYYECFFFKDLFDRYRIKF